MSLAQATKIIGGHLCGENQYFSGVSTDTRTIDNGEIFVALSGDNFDGHDFVSQAQEKGAVGAIVSQNVESGIPFVKLDNTLIGLQKLAADWRSRFNIEVIAVTGSNGKTTVKELIGAILHAAGNCVLMTQGNLNNHIGVPLTLLKLNDQLQFAIIEMGMNHAGEISLLTEMARPTVALINNAMFAHVQDLRSVEAVAMAKGEVFEGLCENGVAVLNADDENISIWKDLIGNREYIDFALNSSAAVSAEVNYASDHLKLQIKTPKGQIDCRLNLLGRHNAMNALAAVATACVLDIDLNFIQQGIEMVCPVKGRLDPIRTDAGILLLDDTYNANPDSMKAGIDVLTQLPGNQKILVAGDMAELGEQSKLFHQQIGEYARSKNVDSFMSYGPLMAHAAQAFGEKSFNTGSIEELIQKLSEVMSKDCVLLIKGSRCMRMERVVAALSATPKAGQY